MLSKINQGLPEATWQRYYQLIAKRQDETLNAEEHRELLHLTEQVERLDAQRLEYLVELARLRQTTLPALMESLDLQSPNYV